MNAITSGKNELGLDLCFNNFCVTRQARQWQKYANFRLLCSTKTMVENQVVLLCMMLLVTAVQLKKFCCCSQGRIRAGADGAAAPGPPTKIGLSITTYYEQLSDFFHQSTILF